MERLQANHDEQGRWVIGNPRLGCRHCGFVAQKFSADGRAVVFHPGVECCELAISDQIGYREDEIRGKQAEVKALLDVLLQVEEKAEDLSRSRAHDAPEARRKLERAAKGIEKKLQILRGTVPGVADDDQEGIRHLELEVARLTRKRAGLRKAPA